MATATRWAIAIASIGSTRRPTTTTTRRTTTTAMGGTVTRADGAYARGNGRTGDRARAGRRGATIARSKTPRVEARDGREATATAREAADVDADADADALADGVEDEANDEVREGLTIEELMEEATEEEVEELTVLGRVTEGARKAGANQGLRNLGALALFFLASTLTYSCYKVYRKATSGRAKRKRTVNKNVEVVERLKNFFPNERDSLNKGVLKGISLKTGYSQSEIVRKYLRYKLTEEAFTLDFVADMLALKKASGLTSGDIKGILLETGERMFKKYGTLMTNLAGLTQSGMERKIDGAGKFAKLMYLADLDELVDKEDGSEVQLKLKETFGATDEDYEKVRITALGADEVDVSSLNQMIGAVESSEVESSQSEEQ